MCDLAGTEPAGDIFFAKYEKKDFEDGTFEYKVLSTIIVYMNIHISMIIIYEYLHMYDNRM